MDNTITNTLHGILAKTPDFNILHFLDHLQITLQPEQYNLMTELYRDEQLSHAGISICQLNAFFVDGNRRQFGAIILRLLAEAMYIPLYGAMHSDNTFQLFFVNYDDQICIQRFLREICDCNNSS